MMKKTFKFRFWGIWLLMLFAFTACEQEDDINSKTSEKLLNKDFFKLPEKSSEELKQLILKTKKLIPNATLSEWQENYGLPVWKELQEFYNEEQSTLVIPVQSHKGKYYDALFLIQVNEKEIKTNLFSRENIIENKSSPLSILLLKIEKENLNCHPNIFFKTKNEMIMTRSKNFRNSKLEAYSDPTHYELKCTEAFIGLTDVYGAVYDEVFIGIFCKYELVYSEIDHNWGGGSGYSGGNGGSYSGGHYNSGNGGGYGGGEKGTSKNKTNPPKKKNPNKELPKKKPKKVINDCNSKLTATREKMKIDYDTFSNHKGDTKLNRPSFQDFLNRVQADPGHEHSLEFYEEKGNLTTSSIISDNNTHNVNFLAGRTTVANIHNHPNTTPPSPQDIKSLLEMANAYNSYETLYTLTTDGTIYAMKVTDREKVRNFIRKYEPFMAIDPETHDFFPNTEFYNVWESAKERFNRLDTNTAWEYTIAYLFETYDMGLTILKKAPNSTTFKVTYVREGSDGRYELVECK